MASKTISELALEQGQGILRLVPTWVPRSFCVPGRRLKLHPDDYYALGASRGGIDERWLASTTPADNGPGTPTDEGLSYVVFEDGPKTKTITLLEAIEELQEDLIGSHLWDTYQGWTVYAKFFDNQGPLPFHIHPRDEHTKIVGKLGKPEAYYFPTQLNNHGGEFPYTFFGLLPGVTPDQLLDCLQQFTKGDNHITDLSAAHRLVLGTGWDVPAGILHAPGSLCTYEPQQASDVFAMYQSLVGSWVVPEEFLWRDAPPDRLGDFNYLLEIVDWEANVDPDFKENHFMPPVPAAPVAEMVAQGYMEKWVCYKSPTFAAKELTVLPGQTVRITDDAAYGLVLVQGHGQMGVWDIENPALIRFGQQTYDEFFVSETAARTGVEIHNSSRSEPIVMLKHFGPNHTAQKAVLSKVD